MSNVNLGNNYTDKTELYGNEFVFELERPKTLERVALFTKLPFIVINHVSGKSYLRFLGANRFSLKMISSD